MTSSDTHEIITRLDGLSRRFDSVDQESVRIFVCGALG